jgi:23S rRNA (guanine2535-N1)-methyltransferase
MQPKKVGGQYQFTTNKNFEDYSSGRVLYGVTGSTNFPVRLASEIFQRAKYYIREQGTNGPYTIYDPFCGAAYSLTVLGLLHGTDIKSIYTSDVDENILEVAKKNLSLLTQKGLDNRAKELGSLFDTYHKDSHKEALDSVTKLSKLILNQEIAVHTYLYNVLEETKPPFDLSIVDLIIADVPYGKLAQWQGAKGDINPTQQFLDTIKRYASPKTLVVISMDKKQKATYEGYSKIKPFQIGTRKILFLKVK